MSILTRDSRDGKGRGADTIGTESIQGQPFDFAANLTYDVPTETRLEPAEWGEAVVE